MISHELELQLYATGWWYTYPSDKYEFVSWNDEKNQNMKKKMFQTTNQIYNILCIDYLVWAANFSCNPWQFLAEALSRRPPSALRSPQHGSHRLISKDFTEHSEKWFSPPVDDKHLHISYIKQDIHRSPIYHNRFHFTTIMVAQIHAGLIYITAIGMGHQWIYASFEHAASPLCSSPGAVWQWWGKSTRVVPTINQLSYLGGPTL